MKALQTWSDYGDIQNFTAFGRNVRRAALKHIGIILDSQHGCGWSDGGCLVLAKGLSQWSGGYLDLMAICLNDSNHSNRSQDAAVDHALVSWVDDTRGVRLCIDGDGLCTESELLQRWGDMEGRPNGTLRPWHEVSMYSKIPDEPDLSARLASALELELGQFSPDVLMRIADKCGPVEKRVLHCMENN